MGWFQTLGQKLIQQQQMANPTAGVTSGLLPTGTLGNLAYASGQPMATPETGLQTGPEWGYQPPSQGGRPINSPQPVPGGAPQPGPGTPTQPTSPQIPWWADPNNPNRMQPNSGGVTQTGTYQPFPMGSLAGLATGQGPSMNQSGVVTLRSPDGSETQQVPASQLNHWLSKGAQQVA